MEITFHGQSCFTLADGETKVVIDPFLKPNNPIAEKTADELEATHVFLTHGHIDHVADAVALAKRTGAKCAAIVELAVWLGDQGIEEVSDPNIGGTVDYGDCSVKLVPAWHTNTIAGSEDSPYSAEAGVSIGTPTGLVVKLGGKTVYHAGDTCLFGDMKMIGEREKPDVAILPIGGHYTMDRHDAAYAAELIGAGSVIPMHFDTFPPIEADAEAFKTDVEKATSAEVRILAVEETWEV